MASVTDTVSTVNGVSVKAPSSLQISYQDIDTDGTFRSLSGYMCRDRVRASIVKLQLSWKYLTKEGWYLTRKDIECYRVKKWYSGKRGESPFYFVDEKKSKGAWGISLADEIRFVKSLSSIPAEVKKISDDIAKKTEEENRIKEKEAERKKFWDTRKDYKCMGCANGWKETPPEVLKAYADKDTSSGGRVRVIVATKK